VSASPARPGRSHRQFPCRSGPPRGGAYGETTERNPADHCAVEFLNGKRIFANAYGTIRRGARSNISPNVGPMTFRLRSTLFG
jgi:hypothetical protein